MVSCLNLKKSLTIILICLSIKLSVQCSHGEIRLVNGTQPSEGRVEICTCTCLQCCRWGTVCDDFWEERDAQVVCRQLGYRPDGALAKSEAFFGRGIVPIALDNVGCDSSETILLQCQHITEHNCHHSEDAGVICNAEPRLMNINATAIIAHATAAGNQTASTVTVTVAWELTNDTLDTPNFFEVACFNKKHRITLIENNQTFSTQLELAGIFSGSLDSYNCCVSAVYNTFFPAVATRKLCTQIDLEIYDLITTVSPSDTTATISLQSPQNVNETNCSLRIPAAGIVGGVLGGIITLLLILLGMALTCLLVQAKKYKTKHPSADAPLRESSVNISDNVSYTQMSSSFVQEPQAAHNIPADRVTDSEEHMYKYVNVAPGPTYEPVDVISPDTKQQGLTNVFATYDVPRKF